MLIIICSVILEDSYQLGVGYFCCRLFIFLRVQWLLPAVTEPIRRVVCLFEILAALMIAMGSLNLFWWMLNLWGPIESDCQIKVTNLYFIFFNKYNWCHLPCKCCLGCLISWVRITLFADRFMFLKHETKCNFETAAGEIITCWF